MTKDELVEALETVWRSRSDGLGHHLDRAARALGGTDPAALAEVVVDRVPVPDASRSRPSSLMTELSGQTPKQLSQSKQLPHDRQRRAS